MSMELLQEKIRKLKNPSVVDLTVTVDQLPVHIFGGMDEISAYELFCQNMLEGLKGVVPAVRFSFDRFALMGSGGLELLAKLLRTARDDGFYVMLDGPQIISAANAAYGADQLGTQYAYDALVLSSYIGSDGMKPFVNAAKEQGSALFFVVRTANRSASELQDLLTGSRHLYTAAADIVSRYAEGLVDRSGYSRIGLLCAAGAPTAVTELRKKYNRMFLLVDGIDTPSGNAKNASLAFDRLGHGAVICASTGITCAWQEAGTDGGDYVEQAMEAARRMQKNIWRYVTVI